MKKGDCILVHGKLRSRSYTDNQGAERNVTEVIAAEMQIIRTGNRAAPNGDEPETEKDAPGGIVGMM